MNLVRIAFIGLLILMFTAQAGDKMGTFYAYKATDIKGVEHSMSEYKGKVVLLHSMQGYRNSMRNTKKKA